MREPRPGTGKRVAYVRRTLDGGGEGEGAPSTDELSDVSKAGSSTHGESAFDFSGGSIMSVAHVLNGRAPAAEPKHASSPQERPGPLYDLLEAPTPRTTSAFGPGMDHAQSALDQNVALVAVGKDWPGSVPPSLPLQAVRRARS